MYTSRVNARIWSYSNQTQTILSVFIPRRIRERNPHSKHQSSTTTNSPSSPGSSEPQLLQSTTSTSPISIHEQRQVTTHQRYYLPNSTSHSPSLRQSANAAVQTETWAPRFAQRCPPRRLSGGCTGCRRRRCRFAGLSCPSLRQHREFGLSISVAIVLGYGSKAPGG